GRPLAARAQCGYYLPFWRPDTDYREGYGAKQAAGGGIILDSIHEFDYLTWLLGLPREVFAYAGKVSTLEIDTEDTADVLMRFDYGTVANVHLDYLQRTYRRATDARVAGRARAAHPRRRARDRRDHREAGRPGHPALRGGPRRARVRRQRRRRPRPLLPDGPSARCRGRRARHAGLPAP